MGGEVPIAYDSTDPVHRALMELTEAVGSANQVVNGTNIEALDPDVVPIEWSEVLEELRARPEMGSLLLDAFRRITSRGVLGMEPATAADFATADREVVADAVLCVRTRVLAGEIPDDMMYYAFAVMEDGQIITHNEPGTVR
jgi:hypothetical protein